MSTSNLPLILPVCRRARGRINLLTFNRNMKENLKAIVVAAVAESTTAVEAAAKLGIAADKLTAVARKYGVTLPWTTEARLETARTMLQAHGIACRLDGARLSLDVAGAEQVAQRLADLAKIEERGCV